MQKLASIQPSYQPAGQPRTSPAKFVRSPRTDPPGPDTVDRGARKRRISTKKQRAFYDHLFGIEASDAEEKRDEEKTMSEVDEDEKIRSLSALLDVFAERNLSFLLAPDCFRLGRRS